VSGHRSRGSVTRGGAGQGGRRRGTAARGQGIYVYRADRLIQAGGWAGLPGVDEHTKLARAALDFDPVLDELFGVNVAKMRVGLPAQLRQMIEGSAVELCQLADEPLPSSIDLDVDLGGEPGHPRSGRALLSDPWLGKNLAGAEHLSKRRTDRSQRRDYSHVAP